MIASSKNTASNWGWWGHGGAAKRNGCALGLMGCCSSWSLAMGSWSSRWILPFVVPILKVLELPATPNWTWSSACSMRVWGPYVAAGWACLHQWWWPIAGLAAQDG